MLRFLKNWTLPVAIMVGTALYLLFANVTALESAANVLGPLCEELLPVTLFLTLFVTFSKVDFHLMKLRSWHYIVLCVQLVGILLLTLATLHVSVPENKLVLEAMLVCVIAPCAAASPVVTAKLGGDLTQMTAFVLLSSVTMAVLIPAVFPILEPHAGATFLTAFLTILHKLALVLLLPLILGAIIRHRVKSLYRWFMQTPDLGFYLWSVSLAITTGITVRNIVHSQVSVLYLFIIALLTLCIAFIQFRLGRAIGGRCGEPICAGQGMFQKNTGLAIWIAYTYLTPVSSIGAGCYVLWQNLINSYELWQHRKK